MKKLVALVLSLVMLLACVPALAQETALEPVTLRWYYPGPEGEGSKDVEEVFNKKLAELLPNTKVEFVYAASMTDYASQLPLYFAGEEPMDIIWEGYATNFMKDVQDGNLLPLDDLITKYGANLAADREIYSNDWASAILDGKTWGVPCVQPAVGDVNALRIDATLWEYFPVDEFIAEARANKHVTEKMMQLCEQFIQNCLDAGALEIGGAWSLSPRWFLNGACIGYQMPVVDMLYYDSEDPTGKLYASFTEVPEYNMMLKYIAKWYDLGWITDAQMLGQTVDGTFNVWGWNAGGGVWTDLIDERGVNTFMSGNRLMNVILLNEEGSLPALDKGFGAASTYFAIPYTCKNPERAMMLINLLDDAPGTPGNDLYNLLCYGFEQTSPEAAEYGWFGYTAVVRNGQTEADKTAEGCKPAAHSMTNWIIGNTYKVISDGNQQTSAAMKEYANRYYSEVYPNRAKVATNGMPALDLSEIELEVDSVRSVINEYTPQLGFGGNGTAKYMDIYNAYVEKLEAAGLETVRTYVQNVIDQYVQSK